VFVAMSPTIPEKKLIMKNKTEEMKEKIGFESRAPAKNIAKLTAEKNKNEASPISIIQNSL
jgi:hypothetical protein